jgi:recombination protein RecA
MAPPFKQAEFDILYGTGISREGSLIDFGVEHEIVKKSGAWYTYDGDQLGQGKENARSYLIQNKDVANEIERKILAALGVGQLAAVPPMEEVEAEPVAPIESLEDKISERQAQGA